MPRRVMRQCTNRPKGASRRYCRELSPVRILVRLRRSDRPLRRSICQSSTSETDTGIPRPSPVSGDGDQVLMNIAGEAAELADHDESGEIQRT